MEVQSGTDLAGNQTYTEKIFSNVKTDADIQNVFDVAETINGVLKASTRDYFVNESSSLVNA